MADAPNVNPQEPEPPSSDAEQQRQKAAPILRAELQIPQAVVSQYDSAQSKHNRREWWKIGIETATLLAVVAYAIIAWIQADQMRGATEATQRSADAATKSNRITSDANRDDRRAWIGAECCRGVPEIGKPLSISIVLRNTGETPAIEVKGWATSEAVVGGDLRPTFQRNQVGAESIGLVPPNGALSLTLPSVFTVNAAANDALIAGRMRLYIYGLTTYKDIFKRDHWLCYCYLFSPGSSYLACDSHNDIDVEPNQPNCFSQPAQSATQN